MANQEDKKKSAKAAAIAEKKVKTRMMTEEEGEYGKWLNEPTERPNPQPVRILKRFVEQKKEPVMKHEMKKSFEKKKEPLMKHELKKSYDSIKVPKKS